ncbi:MAG: 16S rRNA (adenine(1518)-N(6)/adenine(1519)-N(6))-dimethyltransferase RsmA [Bacteroidota bacterium]
MTDRVRAKKQLGQHFLTHKPTADQIVKSIEASSSAVVLEIGPGMGVLTSGLLERFGERLQVIEIDRESVDYLNFHFSDLSGRIISSDFLKLDLTQLTTGQVSVIGNFPYNISSQILFHLLEYRSQVNEIVGMFQREVARRIVSGPGTKEYGILSVLMGAFYNSQYLFTVTEDKFRPAPKVKSGVVRFFRKPDISLPCSQQTFFRVVKMAFNQRRKTLRNALSALWIPEMEDTGFGGLRAEQLGVDDFLVLCKISEQKAKE